MSYSIGAEHRVLKVHSETGYVQRESFLVERTFDIACRAGRGNGHDNAVRHCVALSSQHGVLRGSIIRELLAELVVVSRMARQSSSVDGEVGVWGERELRVVGEFDDGDTRRGE